MYKLKLLVKVMNLGRNDLPGWGKTSMGRTNRRKTAKGENDLGGNLLWGEAKMKWFGVKRLVRILSF